MEELNDAKTALVDAEVNVSLVEVRGSGLSCAHSRVARLDGSPRRAAQISSLPGFIEKQEVEAAAAPILLYRDDEPAYAFAFAHNVQSLRPGSVEGSGEALV